MKELTTMVEEPRMLLLTGLSKRADLHQVKSPALSLRRRPELLNSLLLILVLRLMLSSLMFMFHMLTFKIKFNLFTLLMPIVPKNTESLDQLLFSSDNLRRNKFHTPERLTKMPLSNLSSHLWSQLFSHSPRKKLKQYLDNNKRPSSSSEMMILMLMPLS